MAARAVHTRVVDRVPPADRVSPPPAPASVRLTPLCHTQSQTERSSLPRPPPPPAADSPSNGRALRPRRQFQPYDARSTLWRSPPGGLESVSIILVQFGGVFAATFHPRFRHDSPTSLPACREPTRLGAASLDRYSDAMHSCSVALLRPGSSRPAPITCLLLQFPLGQHSARRVVDSHLLPPNLAPAPTHRVVFTTTYT